MGVKRKIRHIRAHNDEWVQVHRNCTPQRGSDFWWTGLALKVAVGIVVMLIIKSLLPYILVGLIGYYGIKLWLRLR
jgi:hypothetical protein